MHFIYNSQRLSFNELYKINANIADTHVDCT